MKWKKLILLGLIGAFSAMSSCKKVLDINQNPNIPSTDQATTPLLFPAALVSSASAIGGELAIIGMFMVRIYHPGCLILTIQEFRFI